jgi:hypothetical protein
VLVLEERILRACGFLSKVQMVKIIYPIRNDGSEGRWRLGKVKMKKIVEDDDVIFERR